MHRSIKGAVVALALGTAVLTACSGDDAADLKKQLVEEGTMNEEQADCVVKGLQSRGVDLSQYGTPSAEDQTKITEAVSECMFGGDLTVPSTP
jgi:polyhydroxyalkanoate synthesis regulator phasin